MTNQILFKQSNNSRTSWQPPVGVVGPTGMSRKIEGGYIMSRRNQFKEVTLTIGPPYLGMLEKLSRCLNKSIEDTCVYILETGGFTGR